MSPPTESFRFRLYIAGNAQNSTQAQVNLARLCRQHLPLGFEIDLVDVFREPARALLDGILMTPTLVKLTPPPIRKIVGSLSQTEVVLRALDLEFVAT